MKRALAAVALLAALAGAWSWWTSERRRLGARLAELEELFEKRGPEDQLTSFGHTRRLLELFAPGFVVLARPYEGSISDRQQLAAAVQRYRDGSERIEVRDSERELEVDPQRGTAETLALFGVSGVRGGGPGGERFRARIAWVEIDGEWYVQEIEILEVLEGSLLGL